MSREGLRGLFTFSVDWECKASKVFPCLFTYAHKCARLYECIR